MRYAPARDRIVRLVGAGALLGVVALGLGARWVLRQRRREAGHALAPLATSHALVPYEGPGLPVVAKGSAIRHAGISATRHRWVGPLLIFLAIAVSAGAITYRDASVRRRIDFATGGMAERAIPIMRANGCGGCHTIPGVPGAEGLVGPRLDATLSSRVYIAGVLPNNRQNMIRWLRSSRELVPHTAMPSTGMSEQEARDVAAYLYALR